MTIYGKILLTGISGFLGRNIEFYLKDIYKIFGVSRFANVTNFTYTQFFNEQEKNLLNSFFR